MNNDGVFPFHGKKEFAPLMIDNEGLSKRELFAALALQAIIAKHPPADTPDGSMHPMVTGCVNGAVYYADELIKRLAE